MLKAQQVNFYDLICRNEDSQIRVPDYQRGYSWDRNNVQEFFDDITNFIALKARRNSEEMYFLGPIVLMSGPTSSGYNYIVDGQQRMATFMISLAVVRDLSYELLSLEGNAVAGEIHKKYIDSLGPHGGQRYSLLLGDLDQPFFQAYVQKRERNSNQIPRNKSNGLINATGGVNL